MGGDTPKELNKNYQYFGSFDHATYKYSWNFRINEEYTIFYYFNKDSKKYKVIFIKQFDKIIIKDGDYNDNYNSFIFNEEGHNFKIKHKNKNIPELFIDEKSFNYFYNEEEKKKGKIKEYIVILFLHVSVCVKMIGF